MKTKEMYEKLCTESVVAADIFEHLPTLKKYADECKTVTELGVGSGSSTWAFLASKIKKLTSIDIVPPDFYGVQQGRPDVNLQRLIDASEEAKIDFTFILHSDLEIEIEDTDLLFIDTWHVYNQLRQELLMHASKAKKYIILHDTKTFGDYGEDGGIGLMPALTEFLFWHPEWAIKEIYNNCNGLTICTRINSK